MSWRACVVVKQIQSNPIQSKLEGGSAISGITEAEFLGCSLFTKQRLGQSDSGKVLVMTGFRDADFFDCASLWLGMDLGNQGWKKVQLHLVSLQLISLAAPHPLLETWSNQIWVKSQLNEVSLRLISVATHNPLWANWGTQRWRKVRQYRVSPRLSPPPEDTQLSTRNARWGHPTFHQECTIMIPSDTTSLKK